MTNVTPGSPENTRDLVDLNFKVEREFRQMMGIQAGMRDMSARDLLEISVVFYCRTFWIDISRFGLSPIGSGEDTASNRSSSQCQPATNPRKIRHGKT